MTGEERSIPVVAAVIADGDRFLVGRRPASKRHGSMWEFPGGKLRSGESFLEAARRELGEELGVEVTEVGDAVFEARDGTSPFVIHFVPTRVRGTPEAREHAALLWASRDELEELPLAPADARFVAERLA